MTSLQSLTEQVKSYSKIMKVGANADFDFNPKEQAIVIERGGLMVAGAKGPKTGLSGRVILQRATH